MQFIPETKLSESQIHAGIADGTLRTWRCDGNDVMWYEVDDEPADYPTIFAVADEVEPDHDLAENNRLLRRLMSWLGVLL